MKKSSTLVYNNSMWNYRIIRDPSSDVSYAIHEVYYDENEQPTSWTEHPIAPIGDNPLELRAELEYMLEAFGKPILRIVGDKLVIDA